MQAESQSSDTLSRDQRSAVRPPEGKAIEGRQTRIRVWDVCLGSGMLWDPSACLTHLEESYARK